MNNVYIIAEAGVNHNGDIKLARKLIDVAVSAGANAVKFQTFKAENVVSINAKKAAYQEQNSGKSESQLEMLKRLELSYKDHDQLVVYCRERGIDFMSTAFDDESIEFLARYSLPYWKIPSGEITNLPYLRKIGSYGQKIILSTGMSELHEIQDALKVLIDAGTSREDIIVLHCNTEYPTPFQDVNLSAMLTIKKNFDVDVGYSDHTLGIDVPIAAAALGARVIEKHFTLDRKMEGPDHAASLTPDELISMVKGIRNIEMALGDGVKRVTESEKRNRAVARRSIVARREINAGDIFDSENITVKRPGDGVSPMYWEQMIGKKANRYYLKDEKIDNIL